MNYILDCNDVLKWAESYGGAPFHSLLCDPPYELGFMGRDWDRSGIAFNPETWAALAEHLHPGAFGMAFASARGWHRLAVAIEDAGLRIHPSIFGWGYGSGFPKATSVGKQIDKAAGVEREVIGKTNRCIGPSQTGENGIGTFKETNWQTSNLLTAPATPLAQIWEGHRYGLQCLKPSLEPLIVFQKPYEGKPVDCITKTGAGAMWIEGGRIGTGDDRISGGKSGSSAIWNDNADNNRLTRPTGGRWPANLVLDKDVTERMGEQSRFFYNYDWAAEVQEQLENADAVKYCAKASRKERDAGLENMPLQTGGGMQGTADLSLKTGSGNVRNNQMRNSHPTVKPIALCRWLATLLLPPSEYAPRRLLVPFAGSCSEMIGAIQAGWDYVLGIEMMQEYCDIGGVRLEYWCQQLQQQEMF